MPNTIPDRPTSYVPRSDEEEAVRQLLVEHALVTLTGSAGAGKTRLALEVARSLLERFRDGVWLVDLAPLSDAALVPAQIAAVLGVAEDPGRPLIETLVERCARKRMLIVLDNCEHVSSACAEAAYTITTRSAGPTLLATSREVLGVNGERVHVLRSMATPDPDRPLPPERMIAFESVRLFVERARAARPGFALDADTAPAVARVCHRLDGIPLAIELAAARISVLGPKQIAERLDDRFRLLVGRSSVPHHQTLRAAIDWSYEPLSDVERTLFRRLGVFAGAFALEAAESVCPGAELEALDVMQALSDLVDRSLVVTERPDDEPRYRLLETIRLYALERLDESGEESVLRARHLEHFLEATRAAARRFHSEDEIPAMRALDEALGDLRAAMDAALGSSPERALELAALLSPFWGRGRLTEGRRWLGRALEGAGAGADRALLARALNDSAGLALLQGDSAAARDAFERSLAIRREIGDERGIAQTLNNLGTMSLFEGDRAATRASLEESLSISRRIGDRRLQSQALANLGLAALGAKDVDAARSLFTEGLDLARGTGNEAEVAAALLNLGIVAKEKAETGRARELFAESLEVTRRIGDRPGALDAMLVLGRLLLSSADPGARSLLEQALAEARDLGDRRREADALVELASTARMEARQADALQLAREALDAATGTGTPMLVLLANEGIGLAAAAAGDAATARAHLERALAVAEELGDARRIDDIRARLDAL